MSNSSVPSIAIVGAPALVSPLHAAGYSVLADGATEPSAVAAAARREAAADRPFVIVVGHADPSTRVWARVQAAGGRRVLSLASPDLPDALGPVPGTRSIELPASLDELMGRFGAPPVGGVVGAAVVGSDGTVAARTAPVSNDTDWSRRPPLSVVPDATEADEASLEATSDTWDTIDAADASDIELASAAGGSAASGFPLVFAGTGRSAVASTVSDRSWAMPETAGSASETTLERRWEQVETDGTPHQTNGVSATPLSPEDFWAPSEVDGPVDHQDELTAPATSTPTLSVAELLEIERSAPSPGTVEASRRPTEQLTNVVIVFGAKGVITRTCGCTIGWRARRTFLTDQT